MAVLIWNPGFALLLLPLLLCKWGCPHWCHVHSLPICRKCSGNSTALRRHGARLPLQPHGWAYSLWNWFCPSVLWCQLCATGPVVGLWFPHLRGEHYHLARCRWGLVEIYWLVVKRSSSSIRLYTNNCRPFIVDSGCSGRHFSEAVGLNVIQIMDWLVSHDQIGGATGPVLVWLLNYPEPEPTK
ncbi:hypothetical protein BVC80_8711g3 [Macleaya cordata]|uniref:Secreted protein n=1 Tax=Macleaya cordata TaxID=56857 RepID=A0A200R3A6_MACCD|nr:hypothetical protein BVC80_8711g3 [Macleaya cordata]